MAWEPVDIGKLSQDDLDVVQHLRGICEVLELDHACYAGNSPLTNSLLGFATYPDEWKAHYLDRGFHEIDPTLQMAINALAPVDWDRLRKTDGYQVVFKDAREFDISDTGLSIPIRGPFGDRGVLTVTSSATPDAWKAQKKRIMSDLQVLAGQLHDRLMRDGSLLYTLHHPNLSTREIEILQWVAAGKSQQDIADILSISNRTVEVHLRSAREKLSALTTSQAIARAIGLRLIYPL